MAKQLNVNLAFTADTGRAKQQLEDLSASLNRLMANAGKSSGGLGLTQELAAATNEVAKLQSMLDASKNAFGGLDLGKFNQSLKQNGIQITDYAKTLSSLGPAGDQAFAKLARSIVQAEVPLKRTSGLLNEFKTTLMNTARWQISSSILHGFMGALQGAYGYAQDLNESLNNIRIVTGYGKDEMAAFAAEANKAAKALSTTTTEYTNASLIYYQQGLSAEEVKKRTDITVKMANVARQSAEVVSDQMTAVWNNFYDGTKSLEYYADVMTALGAKTASSTDEIAGGLEKFAAIGETIGLSYEYAASALATITSNTRQTEDVVGTALKTIFARIQGLNLGETLDDGTTLNKYSDALAKVGISIFDQAGELKKMDTLLDEMGSKWHDLNSAQQTALAQTVAGVRQYTQLVALMENWDSGDSDSFQANLETTATAEGALQEQADIYAESWEAAQDRVTAALEKIYNQLLDDDFFIGITNGFAGFLDIVSNTIDSLGGLSGVLTVASSIMFKMFGKDMATTIDNWAYNLKNKTQGAKQDLLKMRQDMIQSVKTLYADSANDGPVTGASATAFGEQAFLADTLLQKQQELVKKGQQLSEADKQQVQYLLQINEALGDQAIQAAKNLETAEHHGDEIENQLKKLAKKNNTKINYGADIAPQVAEAKRLQREFSSLETVYNRLYAAYSKEPDVDAGPLIQDLQAIREAAENANLDVDQFDRALKALQGSSNVGEALGSIESEMYNIGHEADKAAQEIRNAFDGSEETLKQVDAILDQLYDSWVQQGIITVDVAKKLKNVGAQAKDAGEKIKKMDGPPATLGQKITAVGNLLSNVAMSISSIKGLFDTWNNEDMSFGDKLISTFTTLSTVIPMVTTSLMGNNLAMLGSASASIATSLGFDGVAISAKVAAGGVGALWAALWPITLIAAAVAAAIAAVVAIVKVASDAYNADAIAAEKAAKAAEDLAKSHEEAKQTLEDLQSAFSKYDEAITALEECTEGTEEWNTALQKVNKTVLELMDEYPNLLKNADVFTRNEITGMLELNRKKQQEILDELEKHVSVTQAASLFGAANASKAQAKSNKTDIARSIGDTYHVGQTYVNANTRSVSYDDTLNIGKILTDNALELVDLDEKAYREKVRELLRNAANDQAKSYKGFDAQINNLVDKCVDYQVQINNLAENTEAAANQMLNVAQLIADQNLGDEFDTAEKTIAGKVLAERENELYDQYYKKMTGSGISKASGADNAIYKDMAEKLAAATGNKFAALTKGNAVTGTDGNRKLVFYNNETGKRESYDAEWVAQQIAAAEALKELSGSAKEAQNTLSTMDDQIKNISSGSAAESQSNVIRSFIANSNFDSGNKKDFSALATEVAEQGGAEAYIKAVFGQNGEFTDDMAKKYGYETAAEFIDTFNTKLAGMESAWNTIELPANLLGTDELSFTAAKALHDVFYDINIGPLGEHAGKQFTEGLNKMLEGVKAEDQTAALKALTDVDWSSWDALDQASVLMAEFGVNIDITSDYWKAFAENMRKATNAVPDFSNLQETLTSVAGILADLEFGDIIDAEDYEILIAYNAAWKEFFVMQADGSREFIGSNKLMLQAVRDRTKAEIESLKQRKAAKDDFSSARWGYKDKNGEHQLTDWSKVGGSNIGTARNLMNASGKTQAALEYLNYNDERIAEMIAQAESSDEKIKTEGQEALKKMYDAIATLLGEDLETTLDETYEQIASLAPDIKTLKSMLKGHEIDQAAYDKQLKSLLYAELEAAESYKQLYDALELSRSYGIQWDPSYYADKLKEIALNGIEAATSMTELAVALQQAAMHGTELSLNDYKEKLKELALGNLEAAASLAELQTAFEASSEIIINGQVIDTGISYKDFADNLLRLGEAYDNCAKEVEDYRRALANGDSIDEAEDALEASVLLTEAAEKYDFQAKELEVQSRQLAKAYGLTAAAAAKLAVQNQRMNKGIVTLAENWEDWSKVLSGSENDTIDFAKAVIDCTAAVADLVGASSDLELPDDFFDTENLALLEAAINGDITAINKLGIAVAQEQVKLLEFNDAFAALAEESLSTATTAFADVLNEEQFSEDFKTVYDALEALRNGTLDTATEMDEGWVAALNRMALATGMSVDNMNELLGSMGVQAKVDVEYVKQPMEIPTYTEYVERDPQGIDTDGDGEPDKYGYRRYTVPGEPINVEGYAAVAQISTEDNPLTVDVNEGTRPSGGSSSRGSGATWTGNRGSVAQSTKDAVKEATNKENKTSKKSVNRYEEEFNEFQEIEDKLDDLSRAYDKAGKLKDQAFGKNKLKYIDQEIAALDNLIANQETYISNLKTARDKAYTDGIAQYGFVTDGNGNITNYDEITRAKHKAYEDAVKAYNAEETHSEDEEKAMDKLEEEYEKFKELLQIYMDYNSEWEEAQEQLLDYQIDKISKELEKITIEVDSEVEINQRDLDKLDYIVEELNRGLHNAIEVIDALGQSVSRYENQSAAMRDGIDKIRANAAAEGRELTDDEQRQIWDYEDQLLDINRSLYDLMDTVDKQVLEEFEKFNSEIDENIERFNTYNEALDYYSSIITLSGRATKDSALMMSIATQKVDTSMTKLNSSYDKYLANVAAQQDALAHLNAATTEEDREYWQKQYDEITKAVETSHNEVLASWEQVLQDASDKFDLAIQQTLETLKSSISEYGLDGLADRYEKATEEQERYLSNLDKEYELNKLSREIAKSIDETDNVHAKQELNKLLDEINKKQASGVKMSKYDLEIMQKQYDVEMAKLALEEARNAKSTVRLRKDNEGNFGYVYTADQDKVADAQQKYEDALYALQKTSEDYIKEMSDMIIQNELDMINALENIDKTRFNTKEEYEAEVARITKYYLDKDLYLRQELDKAVVASGKTYDKTVLGQIEKASTWEEAHDNLKTNTNAAQQSMCDAWVAWKDTTTLAMETVGTNADGFTTTITTDLQAIGTATTTLASDIDTQTQNMEDHIQGVMDKVAEFRRQYIEAIQAMIDKNKEWVGIQGTTLTAPTTTTPPPVTETPSEETPQEKAPEVKTEPVVEQPKKMSHSDMVDLVVDMGQGDYGNGSARRKAVEAKYPGICSTAQGILNQAIYEDSWNYHHNGNKWKSQTVDRLVTAAGYDTGGYTGVWGPEGKLAFLHEKELVLNKNDTSNLLSSVDLLHNIISQIDLMAASHSIFGGLMSPSYGGGQGVLEQDVHIEAHFPNATNHSEIEEAFGNLINLASQYANRK